MHSWDWLQCLCLFPQVFKWWVPAPVMEKVNALVKSAIVTGGASAQTDTTATSKGKAASSAADRSSSVLGFFKMHFASCTVLAQQRTGRIQNRDGSMGHMLRKEVISPPPAPAPPPQTSCATHPAFTTHASPNALLSPTPPHSLTVLHALLLTLLTPGSAPGIGCQVCMKLAGRAVR